MNGRRGAAGIVWVLAAIVALGGMALLVWAGNREYADNQRNWGYMLGVIGVSGGVVLAIIGSAVRGKRRPRRTNT